MPMQFEIDVDRKLIINVGTGLVVEDDLVQVRRQLLADPRFNPEFHRVWDFTAVSGTTVSEQAIERLVATSPTHDRARRAVVCVTPGPLTRALDFITHSRSRDWQIAMFPSRAAAEAWVVAEDVV